MKQSILIRSRLFAVVSLLAGGVSLPAAPVVDIKLKPIGTYATGMFDEGAAEIVAHDPTTQRVYSINANAATVDVLDIRNPRNPTLVGTIDLSSIGGGATSVAVRNGLIAVAVPNATKTDPGSVAFFDNTLSLLKVVTVGALPDMLIFTPDGTKVLVANEGEPNSYGMTNSVDPEGSVSLINLAGGVASATVTTAGFASFNGMALDPSIRIFGPGATVAQDLEPEFIAVSPDSSTAWVTLQENNALATIDINAGVVTSLVGLGFKDHSLAGNGLDASDRDDAINIANWPVKGMYLPDGITAIVEGGQTYLLMVNEGDAREWDGFVELARAGDLTLDPLAFPDAEELLESEALGRLRVTTALGDTDHDGDFDALYAFGARSFSVRNATGGLLFDSGDELEQITAAIEPKHFNASSDNNDFDNRSDDKGPEPEGITVGEAFGRRFAFIALERIGGIVAYDVTDPTSPTFVEYSNNRHFNFDPEDPRSGDHGPEGLVFINAADSPNGRPLLVAGNEVSGTVTIFEVRLRD
jgi:hypothetical protein